MGLEAFMKISDILNKDYIMPDLKGREKREVLDEMTSVLSEKVDGLDKDSLMEALLEREKLGTTGIGYGVAIPHAKLKDLDSIIVAFGRSKSGVDFHAMDSKPVHLFFLIVAPQDSTTLHLKVLAGVSHLLKDLSLRKKLLDVSTAEDIYMVIAEAEKGLAKGAAL